MIKITTERLRIIPLSENELEISINRFDEMERILGLNISGIKPGDKRKRILTLRLKKIKEEASNYIWNTIWIIILTEANSIIGNIMMKGCPNENGEVIIGYSIEEGYECKGYMTEALFSFTNWIFQKLKVKYIIADTLKDNIPSQMVLQKIGMVKYKEDEECFWWKLYL